MRGIETLMHEGEQSRQNDALRIDNEHLRQRLIAKLKECDDHLAQLQAAMRPDAELTRPQWVALYAAGAYLLSLDGVDKRVSTGMRIRGCSHGWRESLRRAVAELSRELARDKHPKVAPRRPARLRAKAALLVLAAMETDEQRLSFLTALVEGSDAR